jgi:acetyl-CoA synthetase
MLAVFKKAISIFISLDFKNNHSCVAESAVVSCPHKIKGEGIFAFISLKENVTADEKDIVNDLKQLVKREIAAFAVPDHFLVSQNLPKTRSGKIMRRILRLIAEDRFEDLGDLSTIADPICIDQIIKKCQNNEKY